MDLTPLYDLRLETPRLELRIGSHDELIELGRLADRGIHPADEMPFSVAWSAGSARQTSSTGSWRSTSGT